MKKQFVPPVKINKKPAKTFHWSDGCPRTTKSINPIYRIARNHYQDLYELYKKLYQIGYICTNQTAVTQVLRYPADNVTFIDCRFHLFKPMFWWYTCDDISSKNVKVRYKKFCTKTNKSLKAASKVLKQFSKKFDRYGRKISMDDKLSQAIKNANRAEKAAKKAKQLVQQYKDKDSKRYLVLVAYDCLWPYTNIDSFDFVVVLKHAPKSDKKCRFSLAQETFSEIAFRKPSLNTSFENCTMWLTKEDAYKVVLDINADPHNRISPRILTLKQFKREFSCYHD